jgi:hypothetical protein
MNNLSSKSDVEKDYNYTSRAWGVSHWSSPQQFSLVLWDDQDHAYPSVIHMIEMVLGCSEEDAKRQTYKIDEVGRCIVAHSDDILHLSGFAHRFKCTSLDATIRSSKAIFFEDLAGSIISYLKNLLNNWSLSSIYDGLLIDKIRSQVGEAMLQKWQWFTPYQVPDVDIPKWIERNRIRLPYINFPGYQYDLANFPFPDGSDLAYDHPHIDTGDLEKPSGDIGSKIVFSTGPRFQDVPFNPASSPWFAIQNAASNECEENKVQNLAKTRLDHFIENDSKLWKALRHDLKALYIGALLSDPHQFRIRFGEHFTAVYHKLWDSMTTYDRSPELSLFLFSTQVFTFPSIAAHLIDQHGLLYIVLKQFNLALAGSVPSAHQYSGFSSEFPPVLNSSNIAFGSRPIYHLFKDLKLLLQHTKVQQIIPQNHQFLAQFLYFLAQFQGISAEPRRGDVHVEFENETYQKTFDMIHQISKIIALITASYNSDTLSLIKAVRRTLYLIDVWLRYGAEDQGTDNMSNRPDRDCILFHPAHLTRHEKGTNRLTMVPRFQVSGGASVSLVHPLQWFLSGLLRNIHLLTQPKLNEFGIQDISHLLIGCGDPSNSIWWTCARRFIGVVEYSIRGVVKSAQIRANVWVRNGYNIKYQITYYREGAFSESLYLQDLYMIQIMFAVLPCTYGINTLNDRFELDSFMNDSFTHSVYDSPQMVSMMIEMLGVIIHSIEDRSFITEAPIEDQIRKEIIQNTIISASFSELSRRIGDRLSSHKSFQTILNELCDFTPPETIQSLGCYTLKKEYIKYCSPFYFKNSRNILHEVDRVKKEKLKDSDHPYFLPILKHIQPGSFENLGDLLHDETLALILFWCLWHTLHRTEALSLVDDALHIFFLAYVDTNSKFVLTEELLNSETPAPGLWSHSVTIPFGTGQSDACKRYVNENGYCTLDIILTLLNHNEFQSSRSKLDYLCDIFYKFGGNEARSAIDKFKQSSEHVDEAVLKQEEEKRRKAEALARRQRIMGEFSKAQKSFIDNQKDLYDEDEDEFDDAVPTAAVLSERPYLEGNCLACQEPGSHSSPYGVLCYIQTSKLLSTVPLHEVDIRATVNSPLQHVVSAPHCPSSKRLKAHQPPPSSPNSRFGLHFNSCGHIMHIRCVTELAAQSEARQNSSPARNFAERVSFKEIICPLCKAISNAIIPVSGNPALAHGTHEPQSLTDWLTALSYAKDNALANLPENYRNTSDPPIPLESLNFNPFGDEIPSPLNEPLTANPQSGPVSAILARRRQHVLGTSRIRNMISQFLQDLIPPNSIAIAEETLTKYLDQPKGFLSDKYGRTSNAVLPGYVRLLDSARICYAQQSLYDPGPVQAQEYAHSLNPVDSLVHSLAFTITSVEKMDRSDKPELDTPDSFLDRIPYLSLQGHQLMWNCLISMAGLAGLPFQHASISRACEVLSQLQGKKTSQWILTQDSFIILVEMALLPLPYFQLSSLPMFQLTFILEMTKIIVGALVSTFQTCQHIASGHTPILNTPLSSLPPPHSGFVKIVEMIALQGIQLPTSQYNSILELCGYSDLYHFVYNYLVIFMRKSLLLSHSMQITMDYYERDDDETELDSLLKKLKLPKIDELIDQIVQNNTLCEVIINWCMPLDQISDLHLKQFNVEYPFVYHIHPLPQRLDDLFEVTRSYTCPNCDFIPSSPAICLFCGEILCFKSFCCQKGSYGECNLHMRK